MEPSILNANLHEETGKLLQKFACLTDDDLMFKEYRNEKVFDKYQIRIEETNYESDKIMSNLDY